MYIDGTPIRVFKNNEAYGVPVHGVIWLVVFMASQIYLFIDQANQLIYFFSIATGILHGLAIGQVLSRF